MKKIITILLIIAIIPCSIFASDLLQMGVNVGYVPTLKTLTESDEVDYFAFQNFSFAPEMKLNLFFIDLDATAAISFPNDANVQIDTELAADLYFKLAFARFSAGVGVNMPFRRDASGWTINGKSFAEAMEVFQNANLMYRAGIGLDFGKFNLAFNYSIPTTGSFSSPDWTPDWMAGRFSVGALFDLF